MTTGFEVSPQMAVRSGPAVIFDNTAGAEYYFSTLLDTEEWVDECAFVNADLRNMEQINGIDWEYCSLLADGVGDAITTELRFYNDTILGAGPTGWLDLGAGTNQNAQCGYIIAGLPGDTSGTGISCWIVSVDLMCGLECSLPQEATPGGFTEFNGIGWMYRDALASGSTGPTLDSNVGTTSVGYGSQDYFELFDVSLGLGAEYVGAFFFGGGAKLQASFQTTLYGDGIVDTAVLNASTPLAGDILCIGTDVPFKPANTVTITLTEGEVAGQVYFAIFGTADDALGFGPVLGPGTTLLIDPASLLIPPSPLALVGSPPSVTLPPLPPGLPPLIDVQVFCWPGPPVIPGVGNAVASSNAICFDN